MIALCAIGAVLGAISYCDVRFQVVFNKYCWSAFAHDDWRLPYMSFPFLGLLGCFSGSFLGLALSPTTFLQNGTGQWWLTVVGGRSANEARMKLHHNLTVGDSQQQFAFDRLAKYDHSVSCCLTNGRESRGGSGVGRPAMSPTASSSGLGSWRRCNLGCFRFVDLRASSPPTRGEPGRC